MKGDGLVSRLVSELRASILILNERGVKVTPEQADERARNICAMLLGNYDLRELPGLPGLHMTIDFEDPRIKGKPIAHTWSCRCEKCDTYNRSVQK